MAQREREMRFADRMSDHEALMWNIEKDPWLNPSGGAIVILDGPIDTEHFRATMRAAIAKMPRLFERVVPGLAGLTPPAWVPDPEFDIEFHARHVSLPAPGTDRQLFDLATLLYQEPFDRTRPLWRFVLIDGLEDGRSAMWSMMHHSISDGIGQLRMAEMYQQLSADEPAPDEVDLEGIIAAAVAEHSAKEEGGDLSRGISSSAAKSLSHLIRRQAGLARRAAGEVAIWPADPQRAKDSLDKITGMASSAVGDLTGSDNEVEGGSPLWKERSRHRHLEHVVVPLDELKAASKRYGVSINDLFLTGMTEGAVRYHAQRGVSVDAFNTSFVISTRTDNAVGGNSFAPVPVQVPGEEMELKRRVDEIGERLATKREGASSGTAMAAVSGLAKFLPTSVLTNFARSAAGKIDFATSNLRGASIDLYVSGARMESIIPMGPVAGTGCNATAMSYLNEFGIGLFIDPVAIDAPGDFRDAIDDAFVDLLAD